MTRAEIKARIQALQNEIKELTIQNVLLCDDQQWYTEKKEVHTERQGRKKVKVEYLIGRINWKQDFKDEDTGQVLTLDRSQVVRIDGEWQW